MTSKRKSVLEQIYHNEFFAADSLFPRDPAYLPTLDQIEQEADLISRRLDDETKPHLERLQQLTFDAGCMSDYASFAYGFRQGLLLMYELLQPER